MNDHNFNRICHTIPYHLWWTEILCKHTKHQYEVGMKITRVWAMPNKETFTIKPIKEIINRYHCNWIDPFPYPYKEDALEYLKRFEDNSQEGVLFDPAYSPRQLKECYESNGQVLHDTTSGVWKRWKDEITRVIKPGGICLSCGWSTNGMGKGRGFEMIEILLVPHGGNHNDTIVTVERKVQQNLNRNTEIVQQQ